MKKTVTIFMLCFATSTFAQQVSDSVTLGPGYQNQVWYSLENDDQGVADKDEWDIAFQIQGFGSSIMANTQKADFTLYNTPYGISDWSTLDTSGIWNWEALHNKDTSWNHGAFNNYPTSAFDLGWGTYNQITHVVTGDSLYILNIENVWKKIKIDQLSSGVYSFTYADIDGQNEVSASVDKNNYSGKNFAYYSIINENELDREPLSEDWDLTFVKYIGFIPSPYGVTGVLHNSGVEVAQVDGVPVNDADHNGQTFSTEINTIGYDWKTFDMNSFSWILEDQRTFFVKDIPGNIWKLHFNDFGGSSDGKFYFIKEKVSFASLGDQNNFLQVGVYPNPVVNQNLNITIDNQITENAIDISIYDMSGRNVFTKSLGVDKGFKNYQITLPNISSGTYQLIIQNGNNIHTEKLWVK